MTVEDFSPTAIRMARMIGKEAGVVVNFVQDDRTKLNRVTGTFDLVIDIGAFNNLSQGSRDLYMDNVLPLTHVGSRYFLMRFEKKLGPGKIERRLGEQFNIVCPGFEMERPT